MKTFLFQILDNEDSHLGAENWYFLQTQTAQLKQIDPITVVSNLLLYLLNKQSANYSVFNSFTWL